MSCARQDGGYTANPDLPAIERKAGHDAVDAGVGWLRRSSDDGAGDAERGAENLDLTLPCDMQARMGLHRKTVVGDRAEREVVRRTGAWTRAACGWHDLGQLGAGCSSPYL
jgi:hypothetical protein